MYPPELPWMVSAAVSAYTMAECVRRLPSSDVMDVDGSTQGAARNEPHGTNRAAPHAQHSPKLVSYWRSGFPGFLWRNNLIRG